MPKGESGFGKSGGSSRISGLDVTLNGETTRYYFTKIGSQNYYQRGVDGTPEPTPLNMSVKEFRDRVEKSGASVRELSSSERRSDENDYKREREATQKFLDMADRQDKTMKRVTRMERVGNRANRRR